ncbi:MAG: response regulator [bacterium]|nr:response regulator [bacterium]
MPMRILLVDDDEVFRTAVIAVLETRYQVRVAVNGTEAMERVDEEIPDLVILDVMMDHLSEGFDVARKLRSDPRTELVPIIMLTGVDQVYNLRMEVGESWVHTERYLEKPIAPAQLLEEVEQVLSQRET